MSEFFPFVLAQGQLPNTLTTLYTVPSGVSAVIRSIVLVTGDTVDRTVNIYINDNGAGSRMVIPMDTIAQPNHSIEIDINLCLSEGVYIEGLADVASIIDYVISGVLQQPA